MALYMVLLLKYAKHLSLIWVAKSAIVQLFKNKESKYETSSIKASIKYKYQISIKY